MASFRRIAIAVAFVACSGTLGFFGWQDYQLRQNEFYRLGAFFKTKLPKEGSSVVYEFKKGNLDATSALNMRFLQLQMAMHSPNIPGMPLPVTPKVSEDELNFLRQTVVNLAHSDSDEKKEAARLFVLGFESTQQTKP